ncbi:hypothetical protein NC653_034732 [Populus alba x Populus x berolinensis]|uniref:Uncharacterized protein n=1 Tax=Populus alba x Populus x berolinensis TaxID=444605 RepID=A0AAD6LNA5_9ROSI|nr:hypothetical protein NC653_034732 [Populus alba x Populus x berolinensis]
MHLERQLRRITSCKIIQDSRHLERQLWRIRSIL